MKKFLLGGTAAFSLLCGSMAISQEVAPQPQAPAEPTSTAAKLTISGTTTFHMSLFQQDANTAGGTAGGNVFDNVGTVVAPSGKGQGYNFSLDDSSLDFVFQGKTDGGLDYKGRINFTGQTGSASVDSNYSTRNRVRQNYVELGYAGAIIQGGNVWGAEITSTMDGSAVVRGDGGFGSNWSSRFNEPFTPAGSTGNMVYSASLLGNSGTSTKVSVMTPTVMGLHAVASFTPNTAHSGDVYQNNAANPLGNQPSLSNGGGLGTNTVTGSTASPYFDQNHQAYSLSFNEAFGDVNVALAGSAVLSSQTKPSLPSATNQPYNLYQNTKGYSVGGVFSAYGFDLGLGYYDNKKTGVTNQDAAAGKDGGKVMDAALGWSYGPYALTLGYLNGERNITANQKAKANLYSATADLRLADGLTVYVDGTYADMKDDSITDSPDGTFKSNNKGTVFLLGTRVSF